MWIRPDELDLTYCTNIHAGEDWDAVEASIVQHALPLKQRIAPDVPFGLGLRLSAIAATKLLSGDRLSTFKAFLKQHGLYVAVINGFPYGSFHGEVVKSKVFAPDWRNPARATYTLKLAEILSQLLPEGMNGGISTLGFSYKPWLDDSVESVWPECIAHLVDIVERLVAIHAQTGRLIHIDIEPEPNGLVESTPEFIKFFEGPLQTIGAPLLAQRLGIDEGVASEHLRTHVQMCFDICHMSVEFESPLDSLRLLAEHNIGVGRIQISSALRVLLDGTAESREKLTAQLVRFADKVYLHQVIERRADGTLTRYTDLDKAFESSNDGVPSEWRIHFHLPLFTEHYGSLLSTQNDNRAVLDAVRRQPMTTHLEIETYTWDVLPEELKIELTLSIEREFRWVLDQICAKP
jgi:hypothetical protein